MTGMGLPEPSDRLGAGEQKQHARTVVRQDIQGLRAVAVGLVLAYHLWPDAVGGGYVGVDAFFVISGFLITAHLVGRPPRSARDFAEFWGRRIRRILPAALLVLAVTAIASRLVAPETQWGTIAQETIASALYVQNWVMAVNAVDYLAAANAPTPVQHYWSLAVEEQFYAFWPILIGVAFWLARLVRRREDVGWWLPGVAMAAVVAGSLASSIAWTEAEPAGAYFVTPTRIWELALGGLIATLPPMTATRLPKLLADGVAWLGMAMVLAAGLAFSGETAFPGYVALLPVGGTALVIWAATQRASSPTGLLRLRPIQHLGDTSYSIYLWHWPLLVLAPYVIGSVGQLERVAILALTLGLATVTKVIVEDPFRFSARFQGLGPTYRFAVVGMVVVIGMGVLQAAEHQARVQAAVSQPPPTQTPGTQVEPSVAPGSASPGASAEPPISCAGADSIVHGFAACPQDPAGSLVPDPTVALDDRADAYRDDCWINAPYAQRKTCTYGDGPIRVALVGNSHAGQWLPALQVLAEEHGWTITTFLTSRCNATSVELELRSAAQTANCLDYGRWVMDETGGSTFDLVITSERQSQPVMGYSPEDSIEPARAGYATYLAEWRAAGTNVFVIEDTPAPGNTIGSIPDCLALHRDDHRACNGTQAEWLRPDPLYLAAGDLGSPGITTLATRRFFCTEAECPAVIGGTVVYFDGSHMTATYSRTLAGHIAEPINAALAART